MSPLAIASLAMGATGMAMAGACLMAPAQVRAWMAGFPRNKVVAWVLSAVTMVWSAWLLYHTPLGRFDGLKPLIFLLTPLSVFLLVRFVDELLAARALGGLMLLVPAPILGAVRTSGSAWRWVPGIAAYLMVIAGISLVLSPYRFRKTAGAWTRTDAGCRVVGLALGAAGLLLAVLAAAAF